jgi:hypothetical protein
VSGDKAPCSFGNNIFINPEKYEWETYNQILLHEKIHISQNHTLDIIIAELAADLSMVQSICMDLSPRDRKQS